MKTSTVKESLFFAALLGAIIFFASVVIVSYAGASSIVHNEVQDGHAMAINHSKNLDSLVSDDLAKSSAEDLNHLKKVSQAISHYRELIFKSSKATSSVMAVYWKIEAADSLGENTQAHYDAIKHLLKMRGDELKTLARPKNISALADKSKEKLERKMQMEKLLSSIELSLS